MSSTGLRHRDLTDDITVKRVAEEVLVGIDAQFDSITVYGQDDTGTKRPIRVDSEGRLQVPEPLGVDVLSEPAYDSTADLKKISIERDNVGLAKSSDIADLKSVLYDSSTGNSTISVLEDISSKVATEATLSTVANRLYNSAEAKTITDIVKEIRDKTEWTYLPNLDVALSTRASEATVSKDTAINYDCMVRRACGGLLAVIDFVLNKTFENLAVDEFDLKYIKVEGTSNYSIVKYADEGIPQPEGTGSPYVLKIVVPAGGTVYVRVPIKARYYTPFSAYITVYSKDYEVECSFYTVLGGILSGTRNKPPKNLKLPANTWCRYVVHWFMESHHGCAEIVAEIYNPQTVDVTVYVGVITAGEIHPFIKGHCIIIGWEGGFYIPLNAETFDWFINIMLPTNAGEVISMWTQVGIESLDGTTVSADIYIHSGGRLIASGSTTSSTTVTKDFKVYCARHNNWDFDTFTLEFKVSASGSAKITSLQVVLRCFSKENSYMKYFEGTVGAGSSVTLVDYWNDVKHVKGGKLIITAGAAGDVEVHGVTPEGDTVIYKVKAGTTETVEIVGRYHNIYLKNLDTSNSASYRGYLEISESILLV